VVLFMYGFQEKIVTGIHMGTGKRLLLSILCGFCFFSGITSASGKEKQWNVPYKHILGYSSLSITICGLILYFIRQKNTNQFKIDDLKGQVDRLLKIETLKNDIDGERRIIENLNEELKNLDEKKQELQTEKDGLMIKRVDWELSNGLISKGINEYDDNLKILYSKNKNLQATLGQQQKRRGELEKEIEELSEKLPGLQKEVADKQTELEGIRTQIENLGNDFNSQTNELKTLQTKHDHLKNQLAQTELEYSNLEKEQKDLIDQKTKIIQNLDLIKESIDNLKKKIKPLELENQQHQTNKEMLSVRLELLKSLQESQEKVAKQVEILDKQCDDLTAQHNDLQKDAGQKQEDIKNLTQAIDSFRSTISKMINNLNQLEKDKNSVEGEIKTYEIKEQQLRKEHEMLGQRSSIAIQNYHIALKNVDEITLTLNSTKQELETKETTYNEFQNQLKKVKKRYEMLDLIFLPGVEQNIRDIGEKRITARNSLQSIKARINTLNLEIGKEEQELVEATENIFAALKTSDLKLDAESIINKSFDDSSQSNSNKRRGSVKNQRDSMSNRPGTTVTVPDGQNQDSSKKRYF